ncbi:MAG: hypothetical protein KJ069_31185 [Anaerolineae bacterium]|nr:hypothetical protein [Anaerolineae bacterium]
MSRYSQFLKEQTPATLILLHMVLVVFIGLLGYWGGGEISYSVLYLWPVAQLTWFTGRREGYMLALMAAVVWLITDYLTGASYSAIWIPFWNAAVRLAFFVIVIYLLSKWREAEKRRAVLMHFIVHDLRSPLATTLMGLELLRDYRLEYLDEQQQQLIDNSLVASNRGLWLVNALLDIPRLESGHMPVNLTEVYVKQVIESCLAQVQLLIQQKEVQVVVEVTAVTVYADVELLQRVLINLLSNALKYSPERSTISINTSTLQAGKVVCFSIADQGPGVPPDWLDKVFDLFVQVDAKETGKSMGSGIGLAFCHLAIAAQGGRIWMENQPAGGTRVNFTLPGHV